MLEIGHPGKMWWVRYSCLTVKCILLCYLRLISFLCLFHIFILSSSPHFVLVTWLLKYQINFLGAWGAKELACFLFWTIYFSFSPLCGLSSWKESTAVISNLSVARNRGLWRDQNIHLFSSVGWCNISAWVTGNNQERTQPHSAQACWIILIARKST